MSFVRYADLSRRCSRQLQLIGLATRDLAGEPKLGKVVAERFVADYWGKARPASATGPRWHPVAYHCLDVAAAGEALLELRPQYLNALASSTKLPHELVRNWLLLALALHDIGKFSDCFQAKWEHITPSRLGRTPDLDPGHGLVGSMLLQCGCDLEVPQGGGGFLEKFSPNNRRWGRRFAIWMQSVFGHHGRPVGSSDLVQLKHVISDAAAGDAPRLYHHLFRAVPTVSRSRARGSRS